MRLFTVVASFVWILAHIYVGTRTIGTTELSRVYKTILWTVLMLSGLSFVFVMMYRNSVSTNIPYIAIRYYAYVWCGMFMMILIAVLCRDVAYLGIKLFAHLRHAFFNGPPAAELEDPARRALFAGAVSASIFVAAGTASAIGFRQATKLPDLKPVDVFIDDLPPELDGFKIVQLSDIHVGPTIRGEFLKEVVARVNSTNPDLVAVTGDLIDGYVPDLSPETKHLADVNARHGLFYCTGNHEYYWDGAGWCEEVARLGGTVLVDEHVIVEHDGKKVLVAGVADYSMKRRQAVPGHESSPLKAIAGAEPHDFSILLAHQPSSIWEAVEAGFDLQLSGHTHGGQFWPWNYFVGLAHPISAGLGKFDDTNIYVSRGTGYWGPPNRFLTPSEITVLTLRRKV